MAAPRAINQAVIRAHREGILTTASLMVNEPACDEAVALARENPRLGVGLHLTLSHGRSALPPEEIPGLVNGSGEFGNARSRRAALFCAAAIAGTIARGKSTRNSRNSAPPACRWTMSTAICTFICTPPFFAS